MKKYLLLIPFFLLCISCANVKDDEELYELTVDVSTIVDMEKIYSTTIRNLRNDTKSSYERVCEEFNIPFEGNETLTGNEYINFILSIYEQKDVIIRENNSERVNMEDQILDQENYFWDQLKHMTSQKDIESLSNFIDSYIEYPNSSLTYIKEYAKGTAPIIRAFIAAYGAKIDFYRMDNTATRVAPGGYCSEWLRREILKWVMVDETTLMDVVSLCEIGVVDVAAALVGIGVDSVTALVIANDYNKCLLTHA